MKTMIEKKNKIKVHLKIRRIKTCPGLPGVPDNVGPEYPGAGGYERSGGGTTLRVTQ